MDENRLEQFTHTKRAYDKMPQIREFVIPTRDEFMVGRYLDNHKLMNNVRLIPYAVKTGFNPSKAFNIGVREAKFDQIIITSPEVKPKTDVLGQLEELIGQNVVCQVWDENESHDTKVSLVNQNYRHETPGYYFLTMFNKSDIEKINGWDEEFMKGYAYEDDDFGRRWVRANLPFIIRDDIQAIHQYHPRGETIPGGLLTNYNRLVDNDNNGIIKCGNGIIKL